MFGSKIVNMHMLSFFTLFFIFSSFVHPISTLEKLPLPSPGPVSFAFDLKGQGPYTGLADGRVLMYQGRRAGFLDFAFTSPNRSRTICDGYSGTDLGPICGRPVGVKFNYASGELYITDPFFGLLVVGRKGGEATLLATTAEGVPLRSPSSVDVDQATGIVYFTDPSSVYGLDQMQQSLSSNDTTGRLLRYDPKTKKVSVLLRGLAGVGGVAISKDGSCLLITEVKASRIQKYWLKGPKASTAEIILNITGNPEKIRRTLFGDYWIGVTLQNQNASTELRGLRLDQSGHILEILTFSPQFNASMITEVYEHQGALYLGSTDAGYIGVYRPYKRL